jgi:hypothetical protein
MRRRDFIKSIVGAAIVEPLAAQAQEPGRTIASVSCNPLHAMPRITSRFWMNSAAQALLIFIAHRS